MLKYLHKVTYASTSQGSNQVLLMSTWNQRVTYMREKMRITKSELAKRVGVSAATVTNWELGKIKKLSEEHLISLSKVLSVSVEWLLFQGQDDTQDQMTDQVNIQPLPTNIPVPTQTQDGYQPLSIYGEDWENLSPTIRAFIDSIIRSAKDGSLRDSKVAALNSFILNFK